MRVNFSPLLDNINSHGTVFIGVLPPKIKGSTAQKYKAFVSRVHKTNNIYIYIYTNTINHNENIQAPIKDHERQASQKGYERVADILDTEKQYGWVNQQRYIHETEKNKKNIDTLEEDSSRFVIIYYLLHMDKILTIIVIVRKRE